MQLTEEQQLAVALRTRAMCKLVDDLIAGHTTRAEAQTWARSQGHLYSPSPPFSGNGAADELHSCLWNLDLKKGDDDLFRNVDLSWHLSVVREGRFRTVDGFAGVLLPISEVVTRTDARGYPVRGAIEGIGFYQAVMFASYATNRTFIAGASLMESTPTSSVTVHTESPSDPKEQELVFSDLMDTLCIDLAEAFPLICARPTRQWDIVRADDHGNEFVVESFTAFAKAHARFQIYDANIHKQSYRIVRRDSA